MKIKKPVIFKYMNLLTYLRDYFDYLKHVEPKFSLNNFLVNKGKARTRSGVLYQIINGQKSLSERMKLDLNDALNHSSLEQEYFLLMADYYKAKTRSQKDELRPKLIQMQSFSGTIIQRKQYEFFSYWLHPVLWNFFQSVHDENHPEKIAQKIMPRVSSLEISKSLQLLMELKLIEKTANGYKAVQKVIRTPRDFKSKFGIPYQKQLLHLASSSFDYLENQERYHTAVVMSCDKKVFDKAKKKIDALRQEILIDASQSKGRESVYIANFQCFKASKK